MIKIEILARAAAKDLRGVNRLITQIAQKPHLLTIPELRRIVSQKSCLLIVVRDAREEGRIVGMGTLTLVYIPTGLITMIEDVVVDEAYRGRGIGRRLTQKMIKIAKQKRAKHISLTTNPNRVAANAMYQKMGFFKKETNYYRINLFLPKPNAPK